MSSVQSVQHPPDLALLTPASSARVQLLLDDPFGVFLRCAWRRDVRRLTIVSPWIGADGPRATTFRELVAKTDAAGGGVVLVTRPAAGESHAEAIACVRAARRGTVHLNPLLHAKLFVCEDRRSRDFAVLGSANATTNSQNLDELAFLVRPSGTSRVISELASGAVRGLLGNSNTN